MTERTIHRCPTCKLPYLGTVCESCFKSAPEVEQTKFIKEYLANFDDNYTSKKTYAPTPKTAKPIISASLPPQPADYDDYDYYDDHEIPKVAKPTLKVFEVRVFQSGVIADVLVMLSANEETAGKELDKQKGYREPFYALKIKEIKGPFKSGSILSNWDD